MSQADLFSMEKYAAGFVEACEQAGIDPVQLVKLAQAVQGRRGPGRAVPMTPEQKQSGRADSPALARNTQDEAQLAWGQEMGQIRDPVTNAARAGWEGMQSVSNEDYRRNPLRALGKSVQRGATGAWGATVAPFKAIGSGASNFWGGMTGAPEGGAAPQQAAAPQQQQMNPNYEQWRQEALNAGRGGGGGDFYDRVQQAEQQFGGRYDQRLAQAPRRRWWEHAPKPAAGGGQSSVWSGMAKGTASPTQGMAQAKQDLATQQARKVQTPQYLRAPKV